jgi:hypothetical protein
VLEASERELVKGRVEEEVEGRAVVGSAVLSKERGKYG